MRIAFMGTPIFASRILTAVHAAGHDVACVYAQPPAPRGRGQALQPSAVEVEAVRLGLKVRAPLSMRDPDVITAFRALELDAAVVVAYGQILTRPVLDAPRLGAFNVHASLLPRWRGAAPIQRAILAGDRETGVQVMRMSEGLDEGPVLMTSRTIIDCEDTSGSLHDKLMAMAVELLPRALQSIETGTALETPQVDEGVTYAKKIKSSEARIDWSLPAVEIDRQIRGLSPWPGAWFMAQTPKGPLRVKALLSRVSQGRGAPGEVLDDQLQIACGESAVRLLRVQAEGRKIQDTEDFLRGQAIGDHVH